MRPWVFFSVLEAFLRESVVLMSQYQGTPAAVTPLDEEEPIRFDGDTEGVTKHIHSAHLDCNFDSSLQVLSQSNIKHGWRRKRSFRCCCVGHFSKDCALTNHSSEEVIGAIALEELHVALVKAEEVP